MKNIIVLVAALIFTQQTFAGVKEDVLALGDLALGSDVHTVKQGRTPEAILENYLADVLDEEGLVFKEIEDMEYGDEVSEGLTSVRSAKAMKEFAAGAIEESLEGLEGAELRAAKKQLSQLRKSWDGLIEKLARQGVKFGYTGSGPGYCGVSFVELLVIDAKEKKVYEVYLSQSGEC